MAILSIGRPIGLMDRIQGLPLELRRMIFDKAGPLTQYLHNCLTLPLTRTQTLLVIADCFEQDAVNKINLLPPGHIVSWELALAHGCDIVRAARRRFVHSDRTVAAFRFLVCGELCDTFFFDIVSAARFGKPALLPVLNKVVEALVQRRMRLNLADGGMLELMCCAALLGNLACVETLLPEIESAEPELGGLSDPFGLALEGGHVHVARFLCTQGRSSIVSLKTAIKFGAVDLAALLFKTFPSSLGDICPSHLLSPLKHSHLAMVEWLIKQQLNSKSTMLYYLQNWSAAFGHFELLQFTIANGIGQDISTVAMDTAAEHGRLDVVEYLHTNRTEGCSTQAMDCAAENGHLHIVQWLHEHRAEGCTTKAMDWAAFYGHIQIVKYLHRNRTEGCTVNAFEWSAKNGHVETFMYLWDAYPSQRPQTDQMLAAARGGHLCIVDFYASQSPHISQEHIDTLLVESLVHGQIHIADLLLMRHGAIPRASMMDKVADDGKLNGVRWLHDQVGGNYSPRSAELACKSGRLDIVVFLVETAGVEVTTEACQDTTLGIIKFLFAKIPDRDWRKVLDSFPETGRESEWLRAQLDRRQHGMDVEGI